MLTIILRAAVSAFSSREALVLENLALRHQVQVLRRSSRRRPRLSPLDRGLWVLLSRIWSGWRGSIVIVRPETVIRWHRQGFRLYWRRKSRALGRPRKPREVRELVRRMARENSLWGAPRIHGELLKLGMEVSQASVSSYMPRTRKPPSQTWRTFIRNHATEIAAIDFFTVPIATFRVLYVFLVLSHDRRRVIHVNVTDSPTATWTALQIVQAFPWDSAPRFIIRDGDAIYGEEVRRAFGNCGIEDVPIAPRSPWQNAYVERLIGSIRRECLDHVVILNERHLRRVLREYLDYYSQSRTHLGREGLPGAARHRAARNRRHDHLVADGWRAAPSLHAPRGVALHHRRARPTLERRTMPLARSHLVSASNKCRFGVARRSETLNAPVARRQMSGRISELGADGVKALSRDVGHAAPCRTTR